MVARLRQEKILKYIKRDIRGRMKESSGTTPSLKKKKKFFCANWGILR